jgi:hypothetical protein
MSGAGDYFGAGLAERPENARPAAGREAIRPMVFCPPAKHVKKVLAGAPCE